MAVRIDRARYVFTCELCRNQYESETEALLDATAEARAAGWEERRTGFWFCGECIALGRELAKTSYT